ncbi:MAG: glycosyltransferase [Planctomycetaceae bacterium]|nr:glycosyltransferase [Planctomycetaceae bacterium]
MNQICLAKDSSDLTIIIPQHGCWEQTVACCSGLWRHHDRHLSITVVDDGSSEKDRKASKRFLQPGVKWIEQQHTGITSAWNRGIQSSQTRYIALLNNDVLTIRPWINHLIDQLRKNPEKLIGAEWRRERLISQLQDSVLRDEQQILSGWCLCFERETYEKVGEFDESMSLYWSDTDWQLRWKQHFSKSSQDLGVLPQGCLQHVGHVSTRRLKTRTSRWHQDRARFLSKWS